MTTHSSFYTKKLSPRMREQAHMDVALELKAAQEDGRFCGYASVFDLADSQRDIVQRGAFASTLQGRVSEIKLLWQHATDTPIGYLTRMFEDAHGLYVEGQLLLEVAKAREAHALLKQGVVSGLSIGYVPVRYRIDPDTGYRHLKEVALFEVSLVTFPANEASRVSVVKSAIAAHPSEKELIQLRHAMADALRALS